jgi:hypothetical protein
LLERWWGEGELVAQPLKAVVGGAGSLIRWTMNAASSERARRAAPITAEPAECWRWWGEGELVAQPLKAVVVALRY